MALAQPWLTSLSLSLFIMSPWIENLAVVISTTSTKLTILCKPPAQVAESKKICEELTKAVLALTAVTRTVPSDAGKTYLGAVLQTTREILVGVADLANSFRRNPEELDADHRIFLRPTGQIWLAKDIFQRMPKNNAEAVLVRFDQGGVVAADALLEAEDLLQRWERRLAGEATGEEEEEIDWDAWDEIFGEGEGEEPAGQGSNGAPKRSRERKPVSEAHVAMLKDCISLVKMAKMLLQKVSLRSVKPADASDRETVLWLDSLVGSLEMVSEQVDDLCIQLEDIRGDDQGLRLVHEKAQLLNAAMLVLVGQVVPRLDEDAHRQWYDQFVGKSKSLSDKIGQQ